MSPRRANSTVLAACALALAWPAAAQAERPPLGLMGTVPIYWGEPRALGELVAGTAKAHWARAALERNYTLRPVGYLDKDALADLDFLLLAQPRALSGEENVALDEWVRGGGRVLLFADPLMTGDSVFPVGDRRRPQDVSLLSPILAHWGLELEFVEDQAPGPRVLADGELVLPVEMAGRFAKRADDKRCALSAEAALARCAIGDGTATILADAAVLDLYDPSALAEPALAKLERIAFGGAGEFAGR